jgi:hypothetical protein
MKRRLPVGIPNNYPELASLYRQDLMVTAKGLGVSLEDLVKSAQEAQFLEHFSIEAHFPLKLSWDEACAFSGLTCDQWHRFLVNTKNPPKGSRLDWAEARPNTMADGALQGGEAQGPAEPWDMAAVYWGTDVLRVTDFFDANKLKRGRSSCPALVEAFSIELGEFLESTRRQAVSKATDRMTASLAEIGEDAGPAWPADLPRTNSEMERLYGEYVFDQVRRVSRIKTEDEIQEVCQQVWLNLIQSQVLEKFIETAKTKLPRTLTTLEVLGYLGITLRQWAGAVAYADKSHSIWVPLPVKGLHLEEDALYLTEDIQTLDTSGFLEGRRYAPRQHPEFSGRGFKSYLTTAIRNHFKNLLRTRSRRHKERGVDSNVILTPTSSGSFHKSYTSEEDGNWEANLADNTDLDMESMLDLKHALERHGVNPLTDSGINVLDHMVRGLTVKSAVRHVKQEQRQVVRAAG